MVIWEMNGSSGFPEPRAHPWVGSSLPCPALVPGGEGPCGGPVLVDQVTLLTLRGGCFLIGSQPVNICQLHLESTEQNVSVPISHQEE
jgi:hypothetical protein